MILSDIKKIDALREKYGHVCASHCSAAHCGLALFIYAEEQGLCVSVFDDGFFVADRAGRYYFPVGSEDFKADFIKNHRGRRLIMMRESDIGFVRALIPDFEPERDRDRDEYVYSRSEQASLEGHKFQKVRAKLSRFCRENDVKSAPLTSGNLADAYAILDAWEPRTGEGDAQGARKALDNYAALGLCGVVTYLNGTPAGYCCGAGIGGGVYLLCSAKQNDGVQGLDLYTKHSLYVALPDCVTLINTESDHGSPGIRMHKNDQRPVMMNEMYGGVL